VKETIGLIEIMAAVRSVSLRLVMIEETLNAMDGAIGDGDLGINMAKGGAGLLRYLDSATPGDDIGAFLIGAGMALNREAPSSLGTLLSSALLRAGKETRGCTRLDLAGIAGLTSAADQAMQDRGKAKPGDKTILDALHPAAEALAQAAVAGVSLSEAGQLALMAARQGRDITVALQSRVGRASWVGERTRGKVDPGAALFVDIVETLVGAAYTLPNV